MTRFFKRFRGRLIEAEENDGGTLTRLLNALEIICFIAGCLSMIVLLGHNLWERYHHYEVARFVAARVSQKSACPGDVLYYTVAMEKFLPIPSRTTRELVASDGMPYQIVPDVLGDSPTGANINRRYLVVPDFVPPGVYFIRSLFRYRVNEHQTVRYVLDSNRFEVVACGAK